MKRRHKEREVPVVSEPDITPGQEVTLVSSPPPSNPPPPYTPQLPPPPPYKLPEDIFRIQPPPSYPSPPIHMAYYLHPLHGLLQAELSK